MNMATEGRMDDGNAGDAAMMDASSNVATTTTNTNSTTDSSNMPTKDGSTTTSTSLPPAAEAASKAAVKTALEQNGITSSSSSTSTDEPKKNEEEGEGEGGNDNKEERVGGGEKENEGSVTMLDNNENFNVVHPLFSSWTLWFDNASKQDKAKDWNEQLQRVMEVKSVEEFWGLYNNIVPPSHIAGNSNYYLFKDGIRPAWEDSANEHGGKWSVQLARDKSRDNIDVWWLYTMLSAIGEIFETPYQGTPNEAISEANSNEVTGVIMSSRRGFYRISIWTRSSDNKERVEDIGKHLKYGILNMPPGSKKGSGGGGGGGNKSAGLDSDVTFESHSDSQVRGSNKNVLTV